MDAIVKKYVKIFNETYHLAAQTIRRNIIHMFQSYKCDFCITERNVKSKSSAFDLCKILTKLERNSTRNHTSIQNNLSPLM